MEADGKGQGYVKYWRKMDKCQALYEPGRSYSKKEAWLDLVAHWARGLPDGDLERGEFSVSIRRLAKKWRWSNDKVFRFLRRLLDDEMIAPIDKAPKQQTERQAVHQVGRFIICKYEFYNPLPNTEPNTGQNGQPNTIINKELNNELKESQKGLWPALAGPAVSPKTLYEIYQKHNKHLSKPREFTEARYRKCRARINQASRIGCLSQYIEDFRKAVIRAQEVPYLCGVKGWRASFDWFIDAHDRPTRVLEGLYDDYSRPASDPDLYVGGQAEQKENTPADWTAEQWQQFTKIYGAQHANDLRAEFNLPKVENG